MVGGMFRREKSMSELEDETERLEVENKKVGAELSLAEKKKAIADLKERGLTPKHFAFDWQKIKEWIRTH